mmetsp:Transcript_225/g.564  ORF Transcript_225/g.564 Transcript_225/m.564 type:complete len:331 (-) Transcript_225:29-1021(-)
MHVTLRREASAQFTAHVYQDHPVIMSPDHIGEDGVAVDVIRVLRPLARLELLQEGQNAGGHLLRVEAELPAQRRVERLVLPRAAGNLVGVVVTELGVRRARLRRGRGARGRPLAVDAVERAHEAADARLREQPGGDQVREGDARHPRHLDRGERAAVDGHGAVGDLDGLGEEVRERQRDGAVPVALAPEYLWLGGLDHVLLPRPAHQVEGARVDGSVDGLELGDNLGGANVPSEVALDVRQRVERPRVHVDVRVGLAEVELVVRNAELLEQREGGVPAAGDGRVHRPAAHASRRGDDDHVPGVVQLAHKLDRVWDRLTACPIPWYMRLCD